MMSDLYSEDDLFDKPKNYFLMRNIEHPARKNRQLVLIRKPVREGLGMLSMRLGDKGKLYSYPLLITVNCFETMRWIAAINIYKSLSYKQKLF